jgi:hypothetical protein
MSAEVSGLFDTEGKSRANNSAFEKFETKRIEIKIINKFILINFNFKLRF